MEKIYNLLLQTLKNAFLSLHNVKNIKILYFMSNVSSTSELYEEENGKR